jgi:hypothetical protein
MGSHKKFALTTTFPSPLHLTMVIVKYGDDGKVIANDSDIIHDNLTFQ